MLFPTLCLNLSSSYLWAFCNVAHPGRCTTCSFVELLLRLCCIKAHVKLYLLPFLVLLQCLDVRRYWNHQFGWTVVRAVTIVIPSTIILLLFAFALFLFSCCILFLLGIKLCFVTMPALLDDSGCSSTSDFSCLLLPPLFLSLLHTRHTRCHWYTQQVLTLSHASCTGTGHKANKAEDHTTDCICRQQHPLCIRSMWNCKLVNVVG